MTKTNEEPFVKPAVAVAEPAPKLEVVNTTDGKSNGLPHHWAVVPIYRDSATGETWTDKDAVRSVAPVLGRKLIKSGAWQKVGEIPQKDPRSLNRGPGWVDKQARPQQKLAEKAK